MSFYYIYMGYVYLIKDNYNNVYKIGVTKNLNKRIKSLQTGNVCELKLIYSFKTDYPYRLETMLHNSLKQYREYNEWFNLPIEVVNDFEKICNNTHNIILALLDNPFFNKNLK